MLLTTSCSGATSFEVCYLWASFFMMMMMIVNIFSSCFMTIIWNLSVLIFCASTYPQIHILTLFNGHVGWCVVNVTFFYIVLLPQIRISRRSLSIRWISFLVWSNFGSESNSTFPQVLDRRAWSWLCYRWWEVEVQVLLLCLNLSNDK